MKVKVREAGRVIDWLGGRDLELKIVRYASLVFDMCIDARGC